MHYRVTLIAEHVDGQRYELTRDFERECALRVGAHQDCDLVLSGREVASFHLSEKKKKTGIRLIDLGSQSGVWIEGERLHSKSFHRAAYCRLGAYTLSVTVRSAGLGEPWLEPGDIEIAQWMDGHIVGVWYGRRSDGLYLAELDAGLAEARVDAAGWTLSLDGEHAFEPLEIRDEVAFQSAGPYLISVRQVEPWQPAPPQKRIGPSVLWTSMLVASLFVHGLLVLGVWLTPTPVKETRLVALEDGNRFAKLFLEDFRRKPEPKRDEPKPEPPKVIVKPKPKPPETIAPKPETVKVRKKQRAKRKKREKGLAEAMASLGAGLDSESSLLSQLGPSTSIGGGVTDGGPADFDEWLASMKVDGTEDAELGRRYQARIEGQIVARKGELRTCLSRTLLKNRGEIRVELSWRILPDGRVENIRVQTGLQNLPKLSRCLVRKLAGWRLATPPLGESVELSFPVVFRET